jgi:hypothetical protein
MLKNGVSVYGGFTGTETLRTQRDFETNVTVLSGDIGTQGDNSDNSYHVVVGSNTNNSTLVDGFTVKGGRADDGGYYGGGIYNHLGSPVIKNVIISDNYAYIGGGVYNYGENFTFTGKYYIPIFTNVVFKNNTALGGGGGMRNQNYSNPILNDVSFNGI